MRVTFFAGTKPRDRLMAEAFIQGLARHGITGEIVPRKGVRVNDCDVVVMISIKCFKIYRTVKRLDIPVIMMDQGYTRSSSTTTVLPWEYCKISFGDYQPTKGLMDINRPGDRLDRLGIEVQPWREKDASGHILICGSSSKYNRFYGLDYPTLWAKMVVDKIRRFTDRPIVYRPKPSWKDSQEIKGTIWSGANEGITQALKGAHAMVTHGSSACFDAAIMGIPSIILGDGVAKPISSTRIDDIKKPKLSGDRLQWLANLAYCQWTLDEIRSGEAWLHLKSEFMT